MFFFFFERELNDLFTEIQLMDDEIQRTSSTRWLSSDLDFDFRDPLGVVDEPDEGDVGDGRGWISGVEAVEDMAVVDMAGTDADKVKGGCGDGNVGAELENSVTSGLKLLSLPLPISGSTGRSVVDIIETGRNLCPGTVSGSLVIGSGAIAGGAFVVGFNLTMLQQNEINYYYCFATCCYLS